jgi:hypothetical protein
MGQKLEGREADGNERGGHGGRIELGQGENRKGLASQTSQALAHLQRHERGQLVSWRRCCRANNGAPSRKTERSILLSAHQHEPTVLKQTRQI